MTPEQHEKYYMDIFNKHQPQNIGKAFILGKWEEVELIDEKFERNIVRVIHRDNKNRRITSFVHPNLVREYH